MCACAAHQPMWWPPLISRFEPVDPGRFLGHQEGDRVSDFLACRGARWGCRRRSWRALLRHRHHHVSGHVTGRDGVDGDAVGRVLACQRDGEAMHAGLGRGVIGLPVLALEAVDRADLDDPAPAALAHALDHRAGDVEHRVEIGVDDLVPLLGGHAVERGVAGDAGVVDQDFHRPQRRLDLADEGARVLGRGHVALEQGNLVALRLHALLPGARLFFVAIVAGNPMALVGQAFADGGTDAAGAAGDQCDAGCHGNSERRGDGWDSRQGRAARARAAAGLRPGSGATGVAGDRHGTRPLPPPGRRPPSRRARLAPAPGRDRARRCAAPAAGRRRPAAAPPRTWRACGRAHR